MLRFGLRSSLLAWICLVGSSVLADSISPSSVTGTLNVGDSVTVGKTLTITAGAPTTSKVDVYFLADTTGSMGGVIGSVKASAGSILSSISGLGDVNFAVGEYKDFGDSYVYRLNTAMTSSSSSAQTGINAWYASGGGDYEEAELYALTQLSGAGSGWRTGSTKILVWFGDAAGHDPSGGATLASTEAALNATGIKVQAIDVGSMNYYGQASAIATATGGHYYSGINSSSIVATIQSAITTAFATYSTVGLDLSEVPAGMNVAVVPGSYSGSYDRSVERTFTFDVTFTGVTEGDYSFNIYGTVNGGRVATEADRFTVKSGGGVVPEPATLLLVGLGLAGTLLSRKKAKK